MSQFPLMNDFILSNESIIKFLIWKSFIKLTKKYDIILMSYLSDLPSLIKKINVKNYTILWFFKIWTAFLIGFDVYPLKSLVTFVDSILLSIISQSILYIQNIMILKFEDFFSCFYDIFISSEINLNL